MNIIATFPAGLDQITVNGLHQWDWGRTLEIHDASLPAIVEVHFACPGMTDAVVRSCAVTSGVATAVIPDACIEQTAPIIAWVVNVGQTSGETIRTITLPVIARTRPEPSATIPTSISDRYTEAIAAMNAAVEEIEDGTVTADKANKDGDGNVIKDTYYKKTDTVAEATHAGSATTAGSATNAGHASTADSATTAGTAGASNKINTTTVQGSHITKAGLYAVNIRNEGTGEYSTVMLSISSIHDDVVGWGGYYDGSVGACQVTNSDGDIYIDDTDHFSLEEIRLVTEY